VAAPKAEHAPNAKIDAAAHKPAAAAPEAKEVHKQPAPAAAQKKEEVYDAMYYLKSAIAGGLCCSVTHGAVCPIDVVKCAFLSLPSSFRVLIFVAGRASNCSPRSTTRA